MTRVNAPKGLPSTPLFLVVHGGFDFDMTVLAVCDSLENAKQMIAEHYTTAENADFPWNGTGIVEANLNDWVDYERQIPT